MFARHGSARTEPEPPPSWEALKQACSANLPSSPLRQTLLPEVKSFVANNTRLTSWGILVTFTGVFLFAPGMVLRVWILSPTSAPQFVALGVTAVAFVVFSVWSFTLMLRVVGTGWHDILWVMPGGFGLLPNTNRLRRLDKQT